MVPILTGGIMYRINSRLYMIQILQTFSQFKTFFWNLKKNSCTEVEYLHCSYKDGSIWLVIYLCLCPFLYVYVFCVNGPIISLISTHKNKERKNKSHTYNTTQIYTHAYRVAEFSQLNERFCIYFIAAFYETIFLLHSPWR